MIGCGHRRAWAGLRSAVLTGRKLRQQQIPKRSIAVAVVSAVVGMFLIPVVGLFVGFGAGLLASEYARRRDFRAALDSSVETLKATGLGILVEFGMVCLAASVWMIGVIVSLHDPVGLRGDRRAAGFSSSVLLFSARSASRSATMRFTVPWGTGRRRRARPRGGRSAPRSPRRPW